MNKATELLNEIFNIDDFYAHLNAQTEKIKRIVLINKENKSLVRNAIFIAIAISYSIEALHSITDSIAEEDVIDCNDLRRICVDMDEIDKMIKIFEEKSQKYGGF